VANLRQKCHHPTPIYRGDFVQDKFRWTNFVTRNSHQIFPDLFKKTHLIFPSQNLSPAKFVSYEIFPPLVGFLANSWFIFKRICQKLPSVACYHLLQLTKISAQKMCCLAIGLSELPLVNPVSPIIQGTHCPRDGTSPDAQ
jgi:hypothetical protein